MNITISRTNSSTGQITFIENPPSPPIVNIMGTWLESALQESHLIYNDGHAGSLLTALGCLSQKCPEMESDTTVTIMEIQREISRWALLVSEDREKEKRPWPSTMWRQWYPLSQLGRTVYLRDSRQAVLEEWCWEVKKGRNMGLALLHFPEGPPARVHVDMDKDTSELYEIRVQPEEMRAILGSADAILYCDEFNTHQYPTVKRLSLEIHEFKSPWG